MTTLPMERETPFDPPGKLLDLAARAPIHRMTYTDGHLGWLVTGHALGRAVLAHPDFTSSPKDLHPPVPGREKVFGGGSDFLTPPGFFIRMDPPEHTRFRKLLTGQFTVRRMQRLEPRITEITEQVLDAMRPPADLVEDFALPIPSLVICELLGVPYEDRDSFQDDTRVIVNLESEAEEIFAAGGRLQAYFADLVARKRAEPDDALISGLLELDDEDLVGVALLLLVAGHETTANMLGLGTYALLTNPDQLAVMRERPSVVDGAVEELLRYLSIIHLGPFRVATADVSIGGQTIKKGDSVTISTSAANFDPARFPDPARLDLTRQATGHLSFGHGIHQCLGQQLARIEMRIAFPALLRRFPELRLACDPAEVPMRSHMSIYGVHRLPVTW
ncbi:cytochrome P450 [Nonomuraea longicatena]|uniref:Cytochrome P450 n=1 Tax=Nonomuraea longicatena TaxID=83682 RepID=A0ABP4A6K1_9ACTN